MATVASIQAQIAALQAQLKQIMAQEGYDLRTPPPPTAPAEPEVAPLTEEEVALSIAQEEPAEAAYEALDDEDQVAQAFEEAAAATMQEAVEQRIAKEGATPPPAEFDFASPERAGLEVYQELRGEEPDPTGEEYDVAFDPPIIDTDVVSEEELNEMLAAQDRAAAAEDTHFDRDKLIAEGYTHFPDDPEKAVVVPAEEDEVALRLFKNAHNSSFDPKSKMDIRKMGKLRKLLADQGGLGDMTDNQFALKLYRQ